MVGVINGLAMPKFRVLCCHEVILQMFLLSNIMTNSMGQSPS
jgi:hypothetical protein